MNLHPTRRSGETGRSAPLGSAVPAALLLLGLPACATHAGGYALFHPTEAMIARLAAPEFPACIDEASEEGPAAIQACCTAESERLEALLSATLARGAAHPADQERWAATLRDRCDRENPFHGGWGWTFELQTCHLDELRRRILWMEAVVATHRLDAVDGHPSTHHGGADD
jgi:hypothetical protein